MIGPRHCEVCKDAPSKYKCPSCLAPYCSLLCYKKHKGEDLVDRGFPKRTNLRRSMVFDDQMASTRKIHADVVGNSVLSVQILWRGMETTQTTFWACDIGFYRRDGTCTMEKTQLLLGLDIDITLQTIKLGHLSDITS
ncbi:zinc finger protein [Macleaya cordata]|uniref:Zinc finger protein n=1 Tax=Macleaya cordata TaxID=56857 RepID=A0A200QR83_MACCD|nr:zinc finger protein [Macleaya cordata]